jgi:hypothetical protein
MATWKKVIVSGSNANLTALQVDNLTSGNVVIGGGTGNLTTTPINGTGSILATTGSFGVSISGSFSGSFFGNGSGLTGVTASFPTTQKTDLANTDQFYINDGANKYVTYGDLLTDLAGTNLAVEGTDSLTLATTITGITSISSTSFTGSLLGNVEGTASWAINALTSSHIGPSIINNVNNYVLTATGGGSINGEQNLQFDGTNLTITGNEIVTGNLTVQGTASFQNTENLLVADRFILLASGSNTGGDGGFVVQQTTQNVGELFGYENSINRWGFTSSFTANQSTFNAAAYITTTEVSITAPSVAPLYGGSGNGYGNIHVNTLTGDIYIYS